jgi:predicted HTH domain antitoxin
VDYTNYFHKKDIIMYATNVRNLKKNPSEALRQAEKSPVLVLKGNTPNALIVHLDNSLESTKNTLNPALASSLFKDKVLSLGAAAKVSGLSLADFIDHLAELDINIVTEDQQTAHEAQTLKTWLS